MTCQTCLCAIPAKNVGVLYVLFLSYSLRALRAKIFGVPYDLCKRFLHAFTEKK